MPFLCLVCEGVSDSTAEKWVDLLITSWMKTLGATSDHTLIQLRLFVVELVVLVIFVVVNTDLNKLAA